MRVALIIRLPERTYDAVSVEEGYRLVDAGLAAWAAGLAPARPVTTTVAPAEAAVMPAPERRGGRKARR